MGSKYIVIAAISAMILIFIGGLIMVFEFKGAFYYNNMACEKISDANYGDKIKVYGRIQTNDMVIYYLDTEWVDSEGVRHESSVLEYKDFEIDCDGTTINVRIEKETLKFFKPGRHKGYNTIGGYKYSGAYKYGDNICIVGIVERDKTLIAEAFAPSPYDFGNTTVFYIGCLMVAVAFVLLIISIIYYRRHREISLRALESLIYAWIISGIMLLFAYLYGYLYRDPIGFIFFAYFSVYCFILGLIGLITKIIYKYSSNI
ncbi:MAG: hypothetical protein AB1779_04700 [Candidatus Thermoplasmatota archaeon]